MRQHEVVAIVKDRRDLASKKMKEASAAASNASLFSGQVKKYDPTRDDEVKLPDEISAVSMTVAKLVDHFREELQDAIDLTATQDAGNMVSSANVEIDGQTLFEDVPATFLLYMEKQTRDIIGFIDGLPVLDHSVNWTFDEGVGVWKSDQLEQVRTRKVQEPIVLYQATEHHPAQTELISRDIPVGVYKTTRTSGAVSVATKNKWARNARKLLEAIQVAREEANRTEITKKEGAKAALDYIFSG